MDQWCMEGQVNFSIISQNLFENSFFLISKVLEGFAHPPLGGRERGLPLPHNFSPHTALIRKSLMYNN